LCTQCCTLWYEIDVLNRDKIAHYGGLFFGSSSTSPELWFSDFASRLDGRMGQQFRQDEKLRVV
jgi:hypothetical protein